MVVNRNFHPDIICTRTDTGPKVEIRFHNKSDHSGDSWTEEFTPIIRHHSPDGFEWGYRGSGPADLALNITNLFLFSLGQERTEPMRVLNVKNKWIETFLCEGTHALYQQFKEEFIATLPREGGIIDGREIRKWFLDRLHLVNGKV